MQLMPIFTLPSTKSVVGWNLFGPAQLPAEAVLLGCLAWPLL